MNTVANLAVLLADDTKGPEFGKASPIGLLVVIVLLLAVFLLIRSMNKQLRKLPESFDTDNPEPDQAFDEGTILIGDEDSDSDQAASAAKQVDPAAPLVEPVDIDKTRRK